MNKTPSHNNTQIDELIKKENDGLNVRVNSSTDIANTFNEFFASVGENLASKIQDSNDNFANYLGPQQQETFFFLPVVSSDVNEMICTLDQSKASGYDDLPAKMLVDAREYVSEPLAFILNSSFLTGVFPNKLKLARVVTSFKKGDKSCPGN